MTEAEARKEVIRLLTYIYQEFDQEITADLISFWREQLRGVDRDLAWKAAREIVRRRHYGAPKFGTFWEMLKELAPKKLSYNPYTGTKEIPLLGPGGSDISEAPRQLAQQTLLKLEHKRGDV